LINAEEKHIMNLTQKRRKRRETMKIIPGDIKEILSKISEEYNKILKKNLTGIYIHGSLAFQCFHWNKSDIDFLVVTKHAPSLEEKIHLIQTLLDIGPSAPPKGLEMSVVLERYCQNFIYPTPYELHFSNSYLEKCKSSVENYCMEMHGTDKDLAAHFTVTKAVGYTLCGKEIEAVFGNVPKLNYLDSIKYDIQDAQNEILDNPIYYILNLCRIYAFINEDFILSKAQGGIWGLKNLPPVYAPVIDAALKSYTDDREFTAERVLIKEFAEYMTKHIFAS